jgi:hypothetical protein
MTLSCFKKSLGETILYHNLSIHLFNPCIPSSLEEKMLSQHWWLIPVILATQNAEIRRIMVQSQPGQVVPGDLISKESITKIGLVKWLKVCVGPEFQPQYRKTTKKKTQQNP